MRVRFNLFILFVVGALLGFVFTGTAGLVAYRYFKESKRLKRFDVKNAGDIQLKFQDGLSVYAASSLDRIFKDGNTLLKPAFGDAVNISLAKNEYESFQIVATAQNRELKQAFLSISELVNEKAGTKIDANNIRWRVVGYVPTIEPYYPVKYVGLWPDPLMPAKKIDIAAQTTQPFWITICAPVDTVPGIYKGTVTFSAQGIAARQISLEVEVYPFVLPREGSLKTAFDFYPQETYKRYPQGEKEDKVAYQGRLDRINDEFILEMLRFRMNPILNIDPTKNAELANIDRYRVLGLNNFSIGKRGGTFGNNWPTTEEEVNGLLPMYRTYGELLKLNRILPYTYIYTWDEGEIGNPMVAKVAAMIHRAYKGLKNMVCYHGFWDPDKDPDWGKDIDIWCFHVDNFDERMIQRLQKLGIEMWMYISGPSGYGSPNLAMDFDSIDYRITPWILWKYDIKGLLYWCVNFWPNNDPFKTAKNTNWEQNANGLLFYPGQEGPIDSLRAEIFRDGMEDYEYIQLLKRNLVKIRTKQNEEPYKKYFEEGKALLTIDDSIASSMLKFNKSGEGLKARRNAIAAKIKEFDSLPSLEVAPPQTVAPVEPASEPAAGGKESVQ